MEFWRIAQAIYMLFFLVGAGIMTIGFVTVINWPEIRGRGLMLAALAMKVIATAGFLGVNLVGLVSAFEQYGLHLASEVMQVGFLLLAVISLTGDGLLLLALINLASSLRDVQHGDGLGNANAPPFGSPEKH
jgi:hypothetical protein